MQQQRNNVERGSFLREVAVLPFFKSRLSQHAAQSKASLNIDIWGLT